MSTLDKFVYLYSKLDIRSWLHPYFYTPIRRVVRALANKCIPRYFKRNPILHAGKRKSDIIVSLTSFPYRISNIHLVIQCLLRQTVLPEKIILWLSVDQFPEREACLPTSLTSLVGDIFEIRFVEGDIRSHKKYYYALKEYPDNSILLVDDDLYYPTDMISQMLSARDAHPQSVICRYGSIVKYVDGAILPYNEWWDEVQGSSDNPNFFLGTGGGTLLRLSHLYKDVLDIDLARELTPLADDVWINAMINMANTPKYKLPFGLILPISDSQCESLYSTNVLEDKNTIQINNIISYYTRNNNIDPFKERF